jgi:hypothetical protein
MGSTFYCPSGLSGGITLNLPSPELYDTDDFSMAITHHKMMDKTVTVIPIDLDLQYNKKYKTLLVYTMIPPEKMREAREFFLKAKNHYIQYTDYLNTNWTCLLEGDIDFKVTNRDEYGEFTIMLYRWQ